MLIVNLEIQDRLINDQLTYGNIKHTEFIQGSVQEVYIKFSNE